MEDSGGMWLEEMEDSCYPFDKEFVESQLDAMSFPEHEQKKEIASTYNLIDDLGSIEKLKKLLINLKNQDNPQHLAHQHRSPYRTPSHAAATLPKHTPAIVKLLRQNPADTPKPTRHKAATNPYTNHHNLHSTRAKQSTDYYSNHPESQRKASYPSEKNQSMLADPH